MQSFRPGEGRFPKLGQEGAAIRLRQKLEIKGAKKWRTDVLSRLPTMTNQDNLAALTPAR